LKTKTIADLLFARDILLDLATPGKYELFERIGEHMEWVHGIRQRDVFQALAEREHLGSTGMGQGIAIPHARIKELDRIRVTYVRLLPAIDFNAPDGKPVTDVLVILVPKQATDDHLQILSDTSQIFSDPRFRERLHRCKDSAEVKLLFDVWPETLS
jgi:PTS system nitrogen regulatory IIA component